MSKNFPKFLSRKTPVCYVRHYKSPCKVRSFFFDQSTKEICKLTTVEGSELPICLLFIRNSTTWLIRLKVLQATRVSDKYPRRNKWTNSDWKHVTNLLHSASRTCLDGLSVCLSHTVAPVRFLPILENVCGLLAWLSCWQNLRPIFKLHCKRPSIGELWYPLRASTLPPRLTLGGNTS